MRFSWSDAKNRINQKKHGISFEEAKELFLNDNDFLQIFDEQHSDYEDRFIAIGPIKKGIIVVITTEPDDDLIRIISARLATKSEKKIFRDYIRR
jgi:uncharacterized DUF497 family protein